MSPTVSVVIPAFNAERWIAASIESVLAQELYHPEILVIDDGSTDGTTTVIRKRFPDVKLLTKANGGQASARNVGIRCSEGKLIAFLDADDCWLPSKLRLQVELFQRFPKLMWCYTDTWIVDGAEQRRVGTASQRCRMYDGFILPKLLIENFIWSPTPIIRREVFAEVGMFDECFTKRGVEDWDMWLRVASRYAVAKVDIPLASYRLHPLSHTATADLRSRLEAKLSVLEDICTTVPELPSELYQIAKANHLRVNGQFCLGRGQVAGARRDFMRSMALNPLDPRTLIYCVLAHLPRHAIRAVIAARRAFLGKDVTKIAPIL